MVSKRKILMIVVVIVVVVIIVAAAAYFLLGAFKPPVDISGVSPSTDLTTEQLVPSALIGKQLVDNYTDIKYLDGTPIDHTIAQYDGVTVSVYKAPTEIDASDILNALYDEYELARARTKTPDWFTAEVDGYRVFFWKSGIWVFGVEAENSETRNQAATELIQHLRGP